MTTRTAFLDRVRRALGRQNGEVAADLEPSVDERLVRLAGPGAGAANLFAARATAAGIAVHRCAWMDASSVLRSLVASLNPNCIVLEELDEALTRTTTTVLSGFAAKVLAPRASRSLDPQFDADVGITGVVAAIAETGTLVVSSDTTRSRGTFIIPPVHIALVRESQVIADMVDLWPRLGTTLPTALTLISGPSKTADIEGILVTGVHGPGAVHVLFIADGPPEGTTQPPHTQGERL